MVQSLKLASAPDQDDAGVQRLNRLPLFAVIGLTLLCLAIIVYGLSSRGLLFRRNDGAKAGLPAAASSFADQLKRGVADGIIGDPEPAALQKPAPTVIPAPSPNAALPPQPIAPPLAPAAAQSRMPSESEWLARLEREQH